MSLTRRKLLQGAAGAAVSAVVPVPLPKPACATGLSQVFAYEGGAHSYIASNEAWNIYSDPDNSGSHVVFIPEFQGIS